MKRGIVWHGRGACGFHAAAHVPTYGMGWRAANIIFQCENTLPWDVEVLMAYDNFTCPKMVLENSLHLISNKFQRNCSNETKGFIRI